MEQHRLILGCKVNQPYKTMKEAMKKNTSQSKGELSYDDEMEY